MNSEDWVRIFNLVSSGLLFYGSYRAQRWAKRQADLEDRAAKDDLNRSIAANITAEGPSRGDSAPGTIQDFSEARRKISWGPYFDRIAYILFCVGFAISGAASLLDLYNHDTFGRMWHVVSR